jgi:hypothetical protein
MTAIQWESMPHGMLKEELSRGLAERDARMADLAAIGTPQAERRGPGRPKGPRIVLGNEAPRGDLDAEGEGLQ